jgi:aminocarboxymuconate-semialdehyde decarboxylase
MASRRRFVKAAAGAAGGLLIGSAGGPVAAALQGPSPQRREVFIGGRRVRVVDIHAHCVVSEVESVVAGTPFAGRASAQPDTLALGPARIAQMDEQGVDVQALTINGFWWYDADRALARDIVAAQNEGLANWCRAQPDRFVALASTSLQFPDLAAEQLDHAITSLGLRGAAIGGHVAGEDLSLRKYDPFWARAEELGALVFMHPNNAQNVVRDGVLSGRGNLGNIIGNPLETTVFLSRLIFDGTLDRFPGLRVCAAHAGGYLPSYLGRTEVACDVRADADCANRRRPSEYLRDQILIDSMVFSEEGLRHLVAEAGPGQIVYGTDVPYFWPLGLDLILDAPFLSDADKEAIVGGTLSRLLRIAS